MKRIKYIFKVYISENVSSPFGDDETHPIALSDASKCRNLLANNLKRNKSSLRVYLDKLDIYTLDGMPTEKELEGTFLKYRGSEEVEVESDNHTNLPQGKPKKVNWASRNRGNKPVVSSTTFRKDMKVYPDNLDPGV